MHPELTGEGFNHPYAFGEIPIEGKARFCPSHPGDGKIMSKRRLHTNRTTSRSAPPVGGTESLVEIEVHKIHPHLPREGNPHKGVHIGTIHIKKSAKVMKKLGNSGDLPFKKPQGVGVCEHKSCNPVAEMRLQKLRGKDSFFPGSDLFYREPYQGSGCRVCAVGGIGNQDNRAIFASFLKVSPDDQESGEFTMGTGGWLKGTGVHSCKSAEILLKE
jgi:hypothetical protein